MWGITNGEFEKNFKEVWKEAVKKNFQSDLYDDNGILDLDKVVN